MNISIIGSGVVGKATGKAFAINGHDVLFYDTDHRSFKDLPKFVSYTQDLNYATDFASVWVICVPTPADTSGRCDESIYAEVIDYIGHRIAVEGCDDRKTIVQKSTLPPGAGRRMKRRAVDLGDYLESDIGYIVNPEFLNAGTPVADAVAPNTVVLGVSDSDEINVARELYQWIPEPRLAFCTYEEAEYAKYANNLFHALLISMWNELFIVSREHQKIIDEDVDMDKVARITSRQRGLESIYRVFGQAWGGACLPKDTQAFRSFARSLGFTPRITDALIQTNIVMHSLFDTRTAHWHELHGED